MKKPYRRLSITATRRWVDLLNPDPGVVELEHIAQCLAGICRFNGATTEHYSVAKHAVQVARELEGMGCPAEVQFAGLHHDSAEAYLGDLVFPVKQDRRMRRFRDLEDFWLCAIGEALGFDPILVPEVKQTDLAVLGAEGRDLLGLSKREVLSWTKGVKPCTFRIVPWGREVAKEVFIMVHQRLAEELALKATRSSGWSSSCSTRPMEIRRRR